MSLATTSQSVHNRNNWTIEWSNLNFGAFSSSKLGSNFWKKFLGQLKNRLQSPLYFEQELKEGAKFKLLLFYINIWSDTTKYISYATNYRRPVRKLPSLHRRKSTPNPKFLSRAKAYFVCHIGPNFQISLIYAFIGCP